MLTAKEDMHFSAGSLSFSLMTILALPILYDIDSTRKCYTESQKKHSSHKAVAIAQYNKKAVL